MIKTIDTRFLFLSLFVFVYSTGSILKGQVTDNKVTNVGNIGMTVTSFGQLGNMLDASFWPAKSSCEFPIVPVHSRIEHLYNAGVWIGAYAGGSGPYVSSAAIDRVFSVKEFGQPQNNDPPYTGILERSNLPDAEFPDLANAISHQDFVAVYTDTVNWYNTQGSDPHVPLKVVVQQETYAWKYSFANSFVIVNYKITNKSSVTLDSLFVGLMADPAIVNTNYRLPSEGSPYYGDVGLGYDDSLHMAYAFNARPSRNPGPTDSYLGIKVLGGYPLYGKLPSDSLVRTSSIFQAFTFRNSTADALQSPANDRERYELKMTTRFYGSMADLKLPGNKYCIISIGPFGYRSAGDSIKLPPDSSINVAFAVVAAKKFGTDSQESDTRVNRNNLYANADWAQQVYNGEDRNGNGIQDGTEAWSTTTMPRRYIFPTILPPPKVITIPGDKSAAIYWDNFPESIIDPIQLKKDFEGYRVYGTRPGFDFRTMEGDPYQLLGEWDKENDGIGYDNGFGTIRFDTTIEGNSMHYRYIVPNLLNGWQYVFGVETFDQGDVALGLESQPSVRVTQRVVPGSLPTSSPSAQIGVYPNPYYGKAYWDGIGERERKLYFYNLPANCTIKIYTLSGDVIDSFEHHAAQYSGSDIGWFSRFGGDSRKMTGGERAWDLISKSDQAIATGLYLFTVTDLDNGDIKRGKFLIIK